MRYVRFPEATLRNSSHSKGDAAFFATSFTASYRLNVVGSRDSTWSALKNFFFFLYVFKLVERKMQDSRIYKQIHRKFEVFTF